MLREPSPRLASLLEGETMDETIAAALPEWKAIRPLFETWRRFMHECVSFWPGGGELHTKEHCERVLLHALTIGVRLGLSAEDLEALSACAVFHDSRRLDDGRDVGHGQRASDYYRECSRAAGFAHRDTGTEFDWRVALTIAYHDRDDAEGERATKAAAQGATGAEAALMIYRAFKDADALDRWRLGPHGLDPAFLRTESAHQLVDFARRLVGTPPQETSC